MDTVEERLLAAFDSLTPAEKQLASVLLENYPVAGLSSISELANNASVSTPTVVRCAQKLGYEGFSELQRSIRSEVAEKIRNPIDRHQSWEGATPNGHLLEKFAEAAASNVRNTLQRLDQATFDKVARELASTGNHVYITGGRITRSLADYLFNHLQIIRPGVTHLGTSSNIWPQHVVDMNERSIVVLFDIRRYEADLLKLARLSVERNATLVLFTDQWGSPIARLADHRFDTRIEAPSSWDSTIAILLIVETLIAAIQDQHWLTSKSRIEELETMFSKTRLFRRFD